MTDVTEASPLRMSLRYGGRLTSARAEHNRLLGSQTDDQYAAVRVSAWHQGLSSQGAYLLQAEL